MKRVTVAVKVTNDGQPVPGFPHQTTFTCKHVVSFQLEVSNTSTFTALLGSLDVADDANIRFFYITCPVAWEIAIADTVTPAAAVSITADRPVLAANIDLPTTALAPALRIKPASSTTFTIVIGLD